MAKNIAKIKKNLKISRHKRVRGKIFGSVERPRLAVFRSLNHIYAQLIDDNKKETIVSASDNELKDKKGKKSETAKAVGALLAKKAIAKKVSVVVFDRGGNKYHGRVKALADGAREKGLKF